MLNAKFKQEVTVLALGAHPDDIEIGAGGFLSRLKREFNADINFGIMTNGIVDSQKHESQRTNEAIHAARILLGYENATDISKNIRFAYQQDCELHKNIHELIRIIEHWITEIQPNVIFTHASADLHDDHKQVFNATISAARNYHGDIFIYQSPSTIPNEFTPNCFVEIQEEDFQRKVSAIKKHASQLGKHFMEPDYSDNIAQAWAVFNRLPSHKKLEAFRIYQSLFMY